MRLLALLAIHCCLSVATLRAATLVFPADAVKNVKTQYGAKGDGIHDDTQALKRAVKGNLQCGCYIYFPKGTYLITDSISQQESIPPFQWYAGMTFIGEHADSSILRLPDSTPAYGSPSSPRAMLYFASIHGSKDDGAGNNGFRNYVRNMTIDVGKGNPGAIGIDFMGNNISGLEDVRIVSRDGRGEIGLRLERGEPGPSLMKRLTIEGFRYGISTGHDKYITTFEDLRLRRQSVMGIRNRGNALAIRKLRSENSVPVLSNEWAQALVVLVDGKLRGGASDRPAIDLGPGSSIFSREVKAEGYRAAFRSGGRFFSPSGVFASDSIHSLFRTNRRFLELPVQETPEYSDADTAKWLRVGHAPADRRGISDDTDSLQAALDNAQGKTTVYLVGEYNVSRTLAVRGGVRRILGAGGRILPMGKHFDDSTPAGRRPLFHILGAGESITIEDIDLGWSDMEDPLKLFKVHHGLTYIRHASPRTLVIRHVGFRGGDQFAMYEADPGAGKVFIEDVYNPWQPGWHFRSGQKVWARQFNVEGSRTMVTNAGADLWILGFKTERLETVIKTTSGGRTELLGGFLLPIREAHQSADTTVPAFINDRSQVSLSFIASMRNHPSRDHYRILVSETRTDSTNPGKPGIHSRRLGKKGLKGRSEGVLVPFYLGH